MDGVKVYVRCNNCEADGPWGDTDEGEKWNSVPRRSEVLELIRLVDEAFVGPLAPSEERLKKYADKLRKKMGE